MSSPTQRTMLWLKEHGYPAKIVEKWVPCTAAGFRGRLIRQDMWGADIQAVVGRKFIGIQACARTDHGKRLSKAMSDPAVAIFLSVPDHGFEVWSWGKGGPRGKRKLWGVKVTGLRYDETTRKAKQA